MFGWFRPKDQLQEEEVSQGLRMLMYDGMCSQVMGVLTGGAFLVAFAVLLGASNTVIGLLAAIAPLTQILQIPTIFVVDKIRLRKFLVVASSLLSRLSWLIVATLPWLVPSDQRVLVLVICLFLYFGLGTVSGGAFNSWMRDLIPEKIMGSYFARRFAIATAIGAVLTVLAGVAVDFGKRLFDSELGIYSILFLAGSVSGLIGLYFLTRIPEPKMSPDPSKGLISVLGQPFKDEGFRKLLWFLGSWNFAINLAAPFFVVYMLTRLGMSMTWVLGLSVLSQLTNILFFQIWGRLADTFSNKSVLGVSGPLFILSILLWPFTTMPEKYILTIPILVFIHILAGMSTAGVTLCSANIALKLAPRGKATSFLATNALVNGLAATFAPIIAGVTADWFAKEELTLALKWTSKAVEATRFEITGFNLRGLDFLFAIAVLLGLYALHRLVTVREEGEVDEKIIVNQLYQESRKAFRHVSNVAGLRQLTYFPYAKLKDVIKKGISKVSMQ
ncbi:MAG: MFS transporter [Planctomycetota bacterium]|jgi:MFS family permease